MKENALHISKQAWIVIAAIVILAIIMQVLTMTKYNRLQASVANYKYGIAMAQNAQQAQIVTDRFEAETSSTGLGQQSGAFWHGLGHILTFGLWGGQKSDTPRIIDTTPPVVPAGEDPDTQGSAGGGAASFY